MQNLIESVRARNEDVNQAAFRVMLTDGRRTPAMEAGLAERVWTVDELVGLLGRGACAA